MKGLIGVNLILDSFWLLAVLSNGAKQNASLKDVAFAWATISFITFMFTLGAFLLP